MTKEAETIEALKVGARHSGRDLADMQTVHDIAVGQGAECAPGLPVRGTQTGDEKSIGADALKAVDDEIFVTFGDALKVLSQDENGVKVGGHLVRFGDPDHPDLSSENDFFTKDTYFGLREGERKHIPIYFNHAMPLKTEDGRYLLIEEEIGDGEIWKENSGILIEAILYNRKEYEKAIAGRVKSLGWSSGTLGHVMKRIKQPNGTNWVKRWIIGEGSTTPMPAEPRTENQVVTLKSLGDNSQVETKQAAQDKREAEMTPDTILPIGGNTKGVTMEFTKEELQAMIEEASASGAKKAIEATEPVKTVGSHIEVTDAPEDHPFKSIAENLFAVKADVLSHGNASNEYPRLRYLKATGASEGIAADGGFLLEPTLVDEIIKPQHEDGPFSNDVRRLPVGANSNYGWLNSVAEDSRATGSRWGGIRGYRLAEAATKTASKPTFRRIQWELKKYAAVVVATDELLADSAMFSEIVRQGCAEELNFMLNEDIFNGVGTAGPQGFMNSGALISVTRTDANKILGADISAMYNRMDVRSRNSAKWYIGNDATPQLDNLFAVGSTAVLYPYSSIGGDGIKRIYGRPVVTTEFNETLGTLGDIVYADMNSYLLWTKNGVESATSISVYFLQDETAFRFVMRVDGKATVNTALTPFKGSTTTSPFVALSTAS